MKKLLFLIVALMGFTCGYSQDIASGEKMFNLNCKTCHSIGKGKIVGPDLKNVQERRKESWLMEFIRTPGAVIKSGDPDAQKLFEEHNKILMPDHTFLTDDDIKNMLSYIGDQSNIEEVEVKEEKTPTTEKISDSKDQAEQQASVSHSPFECFLHIMIGISIILVLVTIYFIIYVTRLFKAEEKVAK